MPDIISLYKQLLAEGSISSDPDQAHAVNVLAKCLRRKQKPLPRWQQTLLRQKPRHGVYLWGDVGRGKTFLMDLLYSSLPTTRKQRWHFQEFMQFVHQQLHRLQGEANPLQHIVEQLRNEMDYLCLDEFLVEDIADAMLLKGLIPALLEQGVLFFTTGNLAPSQLYKNGWQREQFLPTIDYLQKHLYIVHLNHPHDYRRRIPLLTSEPHAYFIHPDDEVAEQFLQEAFLRFTQTPFEENVPIEINDHSLHAIKRSENTLWCTFYELCMKPRSSQDYLLLCQQYSTLIVSHVPHLDEQHENAARRFMSLVDVCYDRRIRLILSASAPLTALYHGKLLQHAFQRTTSRLWEMQTKSFLHIG